MGLSVLAWGEREKEGAEWQGTEERGAGRAVESPHLGAAGFWTCKTPVGRLVCCFLQLDLVAQDFRQANCDQLDSCPLLLQYLMSRFRVYEASVVAGHILLL